MAETPKKTKTTTSKTKTATAAKPRKPAAKKANGAASDPVVARRNLLHFSEAEVAVLAHSYWQQRGYKHGHHEEDWFRAEQELRSKAS
jgi:hypothetical protein